MSDQESMASMWEAELEAEFQAFKQSPGYDEFKRLTEEAAACLPFDRVIMPEEILQYIRWILIPRPCAIEAPPPPPEGCIGKPYRDADDERWFCIDEGLGHMSLVEWSDGAWRHAGWTPALWELDVPLLAMQADVRSLKTEINRLTRCEEEARVERDRLKRMLEEERSR